MDKIKKFEDFDFNNIFNRKKSNLNNLHKGLLDAAEGIERKSDEFNKNGNKISMMGIKYMTFSILSDGKKYDSKFDKIGVFKSGDDYLIKTVFKSNDKTFNINSSVAKNGDITWKDGSKFGDKKSVSKFQQLVLEISRFQKDFIKFLKYAGLDSLDLNVVPKTYYE